MEGFLKAVESINGSINSFVWGIPMLILIIGTGIYFTVRTKFFQISKFKHVLDSTFLAIFKKKNVTKTKDKKAISQFQALSTALAATIGTGNIAGVATAITIGDAGAVFWMWISAFFGMMTNYSENVLGIFYRKKNHAGEWSGGAMYYIENGFKGKKFVNKIAKPLAIIFACFCIVASFGIGNMSQINSISTSMQSSFNVPPIVTGIILTILAGLVVIGGIKRIAQVTEKVVPFMACLYLIATLTILVVNFGEIPRVFTEIFQSAFGLSAIGGGIAGAAVKNAITMGFKRGVFSNEAGLGSSVMVHSASDVKEPVIQGMWGIFEVFFDTMIVCTLTAFTILSTNVLEVAKEGGKVLEGVPLVSEAMSTVFPSFAGQLLAILLLFFAFSTVLGWSFYGTKSAEYVFGRVGANVYKVLFVLFIIVGATMNLQLAWDISDTLNGLMAIPNLIGVLILSNEVIKITKNYVARKGSKKAKSDVEPLLSAYEDIQSEQLAAMRAEEN